MTATVFVNIHLLSFERMLVSSSHQEMQIFNQQFLIGMQWVSPRVGGKTNTGPPPLGNLSPD